MFSILAIDAGIPIITACYILWLLWRQEYSFPHATRHSPGTSWRIISSAYRTFINKTIRHMLL